MAIQIDLATSQYDTPFSGAYFRIVTASVSRQTQRREQAKFSVMIDVAGYATDKPNDNTKNVDFRRYNVDIVDVETCEGVTFLDKCYAWIMTQDDMAGSLYV
jgi:hypothetical protein